MQFLLHGAVRKLAIAALPIIATFAVALPASAAPQPQPQQATFDPCVVHSSPSMVETGEFATSSSIADVITVECLPAFAESDVTVKSLQLFNSCAGHLAWFSDTTGEVFGSSITMPLDNDGNANAVVFGGPSCSAGTSLIVADLDVAPFATATTTFTIIAPRITPRGVVAAPATQVEDATFSGIVTVVKVEFAPVYAESTVDITSTQLNARCAGTLKWFGPEAMPAGTGDTATVTLDNDGNAFAVAIGGPSCAPGTSLIVADLVPAPHTTYTTTFTIQAPRPTI